MTRQQLLAALLLVASLLAACGGGEPPAPVTIENACQQEEFTRVVANGYLRLFSETATICRGDECDLAFYSEPDGQGALMTARVDADASPSEGQNAIEPLPTLYQLEDLRIHTADGTVVNHDAYLQLTGAIYHEAARCYLSVTLIETP